MWRTRPVVEAGARCIAAAELNEKFNNEIDTVFTKDKRMTGEKRTIWNDIEIAQSLTVCFYQHI